MGLNLKLIKRISKTSTSDVSHSSGYAHVQNGGNFGAAGGSRNSSFEQRQSLNNNRQSLQAYGHSQVAQKHNFGEKSLTFEESMALAKARNAEIDSAPDKPAAHSRGYGRISAAEMRNNRQMVASHREAQTQRFAGGVKTYQSGPQKFSGGTGIRPRNPSR